jgi:8-oxo-dGTP diphosphatase
MKRIDVVAGLIVREGKLLVCQRRADAVFPLKWEFPGGKVEAGETHEQALRRELKEELNIEIRGMTQVWRYEHKYSEDLIVNLIFFRIDGYFLEFTNLVFHDLRWMAIEDLPNLDFLDGDLPLINLLLTPKGRELLA